MYIYTHMHILYSGLPMQRPQFLFLRPLLLHASHGKVSWSTRVYTSTVMRDMRIYIYIYVLMCIYTYIHKYIDV